MGGQAGQQAGRFKVRFGKDLGERYRNRETALTIKIPSKAM
jgi:hypothetical protein